MAAKRYDRTHYRAGFEAGRAVYLGTEKRVSAKHRLARDHGFNENSAQDYIYAYEFLVRGVLFKRTLSVPAFDSYLEWFGDEEGDDALRNALAALTLHEDYYENAKGARPTLREVIGRHSQRLAPSPSMSALQQAFDRQVARARSDPSDARRARLEARQSAAPACTKVTVTIYLRDPDVVAEVLERAKGRCEGCGSQAPFLTRSGYPYLEVHHEKWLSRGGEDTVENAKALCPNCHRERHYGAPAGSDPAAG